MILTVNWITAHCPFSSIFVDIKSISNCVIVQPCSKEICSSNYLILISIFDPWGVLSNSHTFLCGVLILSKSNISILSIVIIDKILIANIIDLLVDFIAFWVCWSWENFTVCSATSEVFGTRILLVLSIKIICNHVKAPKSCWNTWCVVVFPVSGSVSNSKSFEVVVDSNLWNEIFIQYFPVLIVLIQLPGQVWNVDTSITFSRKIQLVW